MLNEFSAGLRNVEFARIYFHLEFQEPFAVSTWLLLRLRKELRRAARQTLDHDRRQRFERLFAPELSHDPVSVKRFQRPAPPFVIQPNIDCARRYEVGESFALPVNFFGSGVQGVVDFARALQVLGRHGLYRGAGVFELTAIEGEDASGVCQPLWVERNPIDVLAPPLIDARWWLEGAMTAGDNRCLAFLTPARLLSRGKPLFRPSFSSLFPFALRRVTSMLHTHCGYEFDEARELIETADKVAVESNGLHWIDWRTLEGDEATQELGGVGGSILFKEYLPLEISQILWLASLMNLGKSAAFGCGRFKLHNPEERIM